MDGTYQNFQGLTAAGVTTLTDGLFSWIYNFPSDRSFLDNVQLQFGGATEGVTGDLKIYHDTSNSYIEDAGTGDLIVKGSVVRLRGTNDEDMVVGTENGAVSLAFDSNTKLATLNDGVDVTGNVGGDSLNISGLGTISGGLTNVTGDVTGDLTGTAANATLVNIESLDNTGTRAILFQGATGNSATTNGRVALAATTNYPRIQPSTGKITAAGGVVANLTGNVTGNLTGDVTGNVTGNVTGVSTGRKSQTQA